MSRNLTACCFDTETTQLINNSLMKLDKQPRLVEFCGIIVDLKGRVIEEKEFICNPGIEMPDEAAKITGLTTAELRKYPPLDGLFDDMVDFIGRADRVVAHNLSYDFNVIEFEAKRLGKTVVWPKSRVCTVESTEHLKGFRLGMMALHGHLFEVGFDKAHRARPDVEAPVRCYVELVKRGEV